MPGLLLRMVEWRTFRATVCFVSWPASGFGEHQAEFHRLLVERLPSGSEVFGAGEPTSDSRVWRYHAVVRLPPLPHRFSRGYSSEMFALGADNTGLGRPHLQFPGTGETERTFLLKTQAYCEKDGIDYTFGTRITQRCCPILD